MQIILLERVAKLGQMGDIVKVRDGYARNFLLPQGKALRASEANKQRFESERAQLEARNLERRGEAEQVAERLNGSSFIVVRAAGETGQLYGSVAARDIVELLDDGGFSVTRSQVELQQPIKTIGMHDVIIALHAEVEVTVQLNVARSVDEAERQAKGEDLTSVDAIYGIEEEEEQISPEDVFEEGVDFESEEATAAETAATEESEENEV
jgi:large subunit ribosomal protein L9